MDLALVESSVRISGNRWADKGDLDSGVCGLDGASKGVIARPADSRGEEDQELKALRELDGLFRGDVVRRCVKELRTLQHTGGIGEPDRIPVGLDLAGCGPA